MAPSVGAFLMIYGLTMLGIAAGYFFTYGTYTITHYYKKVFGMSIEYLKTMGR